MVAPTYKTFSDLPEWATSCIRKFRPDDAETWIFHPVPALQNRSFIEVINQGDEGINRVRRYLNDVLGRFFPEEDQLGSTGVWQGGR